MPDELGHTTATPSVSSVLRALTKDRLLAIGREFRASVPVHATKEEQIAALARSRLVGFDDLLQWLGRDELKAACRAHGLPDEGRARAALADRLRQAYGPIERPPSAAYPAVDAYTPVKGSIVRVRQRQYLVEDVSPPPEPGHATAVELVCLDDDNQGRRLTVLWELELGAAVLQPEAHGLGPVTRLDPPRHFAAYWHALQWNAVTATDAKLFQAPFRAGIKLMNHQLTPLKKALELPRSNLFIADDVGLGKTIEAGLVLQELLLRQRVDFAVIVCPASVALQWRDEMQKRFGLHFELYNRAFVGRRRQERGFGVNPWSTHNRFIITYQTLRRPEYRDPLLQHIGERIKKSLLILDEAHTAAPASASKYAIDSRVTRVIRDVAPRFENRLFLSATPHNGHSNSFSALLEILDPQRFTRGVKVRGPAQLEPVMVRRLKRDLRDLKVGNYPDRHVVQVDLRSEGDTWQARYARLEKEKLVYEGAPIPIGTGTPAELELSRLLQEYTALMRPKKGRGQLVFINLQKRLLSSIEAFARTLRLHEKSVGEGKAHTSLQLTLDDLEDEYGVDDETLEEAAAADIVASSAAVASPEGRARQILAEMVAIADTHRGAPDAKALALLDWIRRHQCSGVQLGGGGRGPWTDRRVLVFTEYGDTKRYLWQLLSTAVEGTHQADERIMQLHGGMSDEQREEVQRAFNSRPDEHPVRILIATDAAREGINLQGHCADLFHYDVPWNPARMEQRNGRIDRTLQPQPVVRCHYFVYPQRAEDRVLQTLVGKIETIQDQLGSLGDVVMGRMADAMDDGIAADTALRLEHAQAVEGGEVVIAELESQRTDLKAVLAEINRAGRILEDSQKSMNFREDYLLDPIDVGLALAGAGPLRPLPGKEGAPPAYRLPELPPSWTETLDTLRPPGGREEPLWEWRKRPPQPVVFKAPDEMTSGVAHLHLHHPFVRRVLGRFLAQGYSAHDLSRVTVVHTARDYIVRVFAFGRLSLFGAGATRLHDKIITVAAPWLDGGGPEHLAPFSEADEQLELAKLQQVLRGAPELTVNPRVQERLRATAGRDFAELWQHVRNEADAEGHQARQKLAARAHVESAALRRILETQREAILEELAGGRQLPLGLEDADEAQRRQFEDDRKHMERRLADIENELATEPELIEDLYRVVLTRLEPVGMIYLWPETLG